MIHKERVIKLLQDLIRIDSQNPGTCEEEIACFVKAYLDKLGVRTKTYEFRKRRPNIIAYLGGSGAKDSLLITPHLDTVPAGKSWRHDPFAARLISGKVYGLGATDCKCNIACALEAIRSIVEDSAVLNYRLIFAATADEESGSECGLIPLLKRGILRPQAAVVLDSDDYSIIVAQKGLMHLKVTIRGKKAHGAYPWLGTNAIDIAVSILKDIKRETFKYSKNKYLREPTVNIGTIRGGDKVNVVADWCEFELDFRFVPGMSAQELLSALKHIIRRHASKFWIESEGIQQPYTIAEEHPLVYCLKKAMVRTDIRPRVSGSEGATVITFFQNYGIPAIATGFGSEGCAHKADEYVKAANLYRGARVLEEFLKSFKFEAQAA